MVCPTGISSHMSSPAFDFFLEFGAYCHERHPLDVWVNASTLVRTGVLGTYARPRSASLRESVRNAGGLEWMLTRTLVRQARRRCFFDGEGASVVGLFPFNRHDYEGLIRPYLKALASTGTRCAVVTSGRGFDRWRLHAREDGTVIFPAEAAVSMGVYSDAKRTLATLRPSLLDIASRFRLSATRRRSLMVYFAQYCFEKALASRFIEHFAPRVIIGLHFVSTRGWHGAIADAASRGPHPSVVLVQHGSFDVSRGFHDFEGADLVLLWGDRWRRELSRYQSLPFRKVPTALVTGHPKYDLSEDAIPPATLHGGGSARSRNGVHVLFVSSHEGGRTKEAPLAQLIAAAQRGRGFDFTVKPHPAERDGTLARVVAKGQLHARQVLSAQEPIQACILDADVVVGPESTALFEAVRLGRPVVLLSEAPSGAFSGLLTAVDSASLHALVERLRKDVAWRRSVLDEQSEALVDAFGSATGAVEAGTESIRRHL